MTIDKTQKRKEKVWIAIRLPYLSLESLGISRSYDNILISDKNIVCASTENLYKNGIRLGMPLSTAQLFYDAQDHIPCRIYEREIESETKVCNTLCHEIYNYTPHIEIYKIRSPKGCEETSLIIEVSSCLKLFKDLTHIVEKISAIIDNNKITYCLGKGHTKHMAWLLSHTRQDITALQNRNDFIALVMDLTIDMLYEYPKIVSQLKKSGFFKFRDIIQQLEKESLHSLSTRFGEEITQHICDIFDIDNSLLQRSLFDTPITTYQPHYNFVDSIQFDFPISNVEQLLHPINKLLSLLTDTLVKKQLQTKSICWNLYDIYQNKEIINVNFDRLYRDKSFACTLTMIQLENQNLPFEVDTLELECEKTFPVNFDKKLFESPNFSPENNREITTVTTKLNARLGENAMFVLSPVESYIPELSFKKNKFDGAKIIPQLTVPQQNTNRPSWIFNTPIKIGKRQNTLFWKGNLELLQGPERIEGTWWETPTARDYFIAKRCDHVRLWVFNDLYNDIWFVHGMFA